jgi:hypothetical protein
MTLDTTIDSLFGDIVSTELTDLFNKPASHNRAMWCSNDKSAILDHRARDLERRKVAANKSAEAKVKREEKARLEAAKAEANRAAGANELFPLINAVYMGDNGVLFCGNDSSCTKQRVVNATGEDDHWRRCPSCTKMYCFLKPCQANLIKHIKLCRQKELLMQSQHGDEVM